MRLRSVVNASKQTAPSAQYILEWRLLNTLLQSARYRSSGNYRTIAKYLRSVELNTS